MKIFTFKAINIFNEFLPCYSLLTSLSFVEHCHQKRNPPFLRNRNGAPGYSPSQPPPETATEYGNKIKTEDASANKTKTSEDSS